MEEKTHSEKVNSRLGQGGYTLIELVIALGIISILASMAVPRFEFYVAKAKQTQAKIDLAALNQAEQLFFASNGFYTGDFRDLGLTLSGSPMTYNVGFAGPGYAPAGFVGDSSGGCAARTAFNTDVSDCTISSGSQAAETPFAQATAGGGCGAGADPSLGGFRATAVGDIADGSTDVWTIDQNGTLCNNSPGLFATATTPGSPGSPGSPGGAMPLPPP